MLLLYELGFCFVVGAHPTAVAKRFDALADIALFHFSHNRWCWKREWGKTKSRSCFSTSRPDSPSGTNDPPDQEAEVIALLVQPPVTSEGLERRRTTNEYGRGSFRLEYAMRSLQRAARSTPLLHTWGC